MASKNEKQDELPDTVDAGDASAAPDQSNPGNESLSGKDVDKTDQRTEGSRGWLGVTPAEWIMIGFTALTAGGTVLLWRVSANQLTFAIDSASSSAKDTQDSLVLTRRLATAAENQATSAYASARAAQASAEAANRQSAYSQTQTDAILKQAKALIQGAQSTVRAADAEIAGAQANIRTAESGARAAEQQLIAAQVLAEGQQPFANFQSVSLTYADKPADSQMQKVVKVLVKPNYSNFGQSDLFPIKISFSMSLSSSFPVVPPLKPDFVFGGNETPIPHLAIFSTDGDFDYYLNKQDVESFMAGMKPAFVWGRIEYSDKGRHTFTTCYGMLVRMQKSPTARQIVDRAGPPAFHCGGG